MNNNHKRKSRKIKLKNFFLKHIIFILTLVLLLFPFAIHLICKITSKFICLNESNLLQFYGVALGIFFSFITYYIEKKKGKAEHDIKLKPYISVELEARDDGYFTLTLTSLKNAILTDVFLYDIPLDNTLPSTKAYNVNFYPDNEKGEEIDLSGYDSSLMDSDGYPKYILLSCCDEENRMWQGEYIKLSNNNKIVYQLKEMYLV